VSGPASSASSATGARRGRRPGAPDTRAAILAAARERFAASGYAGTSIRAVAAAAGVDGALVHHYFGTKDDLFLAALELPVDPRALLAPVAEAGADEAGERLLRVFLGVWDDERNQPSLLALVRGLAEPNGQRLVRDGVLQMILGPLGRALALDRPEERMALVASQMVGIVILRYLLRAEPLASISPDALVAVYAPTLQRYLTGPLG
jgi:AcrR family transcriptional regulator